MLAMGLFCLFLIDLIDNNNLKCDGFALILTSLIAIPRAHFADFGGLYSSCTLSPVTFNLSGRSQFSSR